MFSKLPIIPQYKMLLCYNIKRGMNTAYYRYVIHEFVPSLSEMDIYVLEAWHTAYGDYPVRQVEYVVDGIDVLKTAFLSDEWQSLETRLQSYTQAYSRKIIPFQTGFQF